LDIGGTFAVPRPLAAVEYATANATIAETVTRRKVVSRGSLMFIGPSSIAFGPVIRATLHGAFSLRVVEVEHVAVSSSTIVRVTELFAIRVEVVDHVMHGFSVADRMAAT
jgi:hypothetical protein